MGSGYSDDMYRAAGAEMVENGEEIYSRSEMVVKVKEPQPREIEHFHQELILFSYFHFAGSRELTEACLEKHVTAMAYETLADDHGRLPLLTPMSEVAGKMSIQEGAKYLEKPMMGRGILLGGVPGVEPADVLIVGGGVVGASAAGVAAGLGANVAIMDVNLDRLRYLDTIMPANVTTVYCDPDTIHRYAIDADLIVGAVLIPGGKTPVLISHDIVKQMKKGSVLVDVAVDQGGCCETSHPTTHSDPIFIVDGVVHYCVTNMPGAVGRTSTQALCNATLPYCRELAGMGLDGFISKSAGRAAALNMRDGGICCSAVSDTFPCMSCL
jgi:alanine dehydrogenase